MARCRRALPEGRGAKDHRQGPGAQELRLADLPRAREVVEGFGERSKDAARRLEHPLARGAPRGHGGRLFRIGLRGYRTATTATVQPQRLFQLRAGERRQAREGDLERGADDPEEWDLRRLPCEGE